MENKVITFKLQGNKINLNDMKPEDAISVINDFVKAIKKIDKNFKLNNIKSGSLAISLNMEEFIESSNKKSENWIQKVKDILNQNVEYLITGDGGCLLNISGALEKCNAKVKTMYLFEFLAKRIGIA